MKLESIAHAVGIIGVVASLSFVGFQIGQQNKVLKSQTNVELLNASFSLRDSVATNKDIVKLILLADAENSELTDEQRLRYFAFISRAFDVWEHAYLAKRNGLIELEQWTAWDNAYKEMISRSGPTNYWLMYNRDYSESFRSHVKSHISASKNSLNKSNKPVVVNGASS